MRIYIPCEKRISLVDKDLTYCEGLCTGEDAGILEYVPGRESHHSLFDIYRTIQCPKLMRSSSIKTYPTGLVVMFDRRAIDIPDEYGRRPEHREKVEREKAYSLNPAHLIALAHIGQLSAFV